MRLTRVALIFYVLVWFNVIVPGHTRGVITLPAGDASMSAGGCCPTKLPGQKPTPAEQKRCAICFVAATYTLPPVFTINLEPGESLGTHVAVVLRQVRFLDYPAPFWPVGPPAFA